MRNARSNVLTKISGANTSGNWEITSYINTSGNWENEKLCGNTIFYNIAQRNIKKEISVLTYINTALSRTLCYIIKKIFSKARVSTCMYFLVIFDNIAIGMQ